MAFCSHESLGAGVGGFELRVEAERIAPAGVVHAVEIAFDGLHAVDAPFVFGDGLRDLTFVRGLRIVALNDGHGEV